MNRVLARVSLMLLALWLPTSVLAADDDADEAVLDQLDQARERGVLEVAVYRDFPPYSYPQQGKYVGADVDLAAALARKIGLPLKVRPIMPGDDADDDLRNNIWKGHYLGGGVADVGGADRLVGVPQAHLAQAGVGAGGQLCRRGPGIWP